MFQRDVASVQEVGALIRDARPKQNRTKAEVVEQAEVPREWLIGVERRNRPRTEFTRVLAVIETLGIGLSAQVAGAGDSKPALAKKLARQIPASKSLTADEPADNDGQDFVPFIRRSGFEQGSGAG